MCNPETLVFGDIKHVDIRWGSLQRSQVVEKRRISVA